MRARILILILDGTDAVLRIDLMEEEIRRHLFRDTSGNETGRVKK